jgi:predicted transcriptional regulator
MSTTTIRIEEQLKDRVTAAAEQQGKTAHAFILEAIAQKVEQVEVEAEAIQVAEGRWNKLVDTGRSVGWDDAKAYLEARAVGKRVRRPAARKLGP